MKAIDIAFQSQDALGGFGERIDAGRPRGGGVAGAPVKENLHLKEPAFGVAYLQVALLADQAIVGFDEPAGSDFVHQEDGAFGAAGFLIGNDMRLQPALERRVFETLAHQHHDAGRGLHVRRAPAVDLPSILADTRLVRTGNPGIGIRNRNGIEVAIHHNSWAVVVADGDDDIGLRRVFGEDFVGESMFVAPVSHPLHDGDLDASGRGYGDQLARQLHDLIPAHPPLARIFGHPSFLSGANGQLDTGRLAGAIVHHRKPKAGMTVDAGPVPA